MTEEKIRVTFGHSTDENGEPFEFVEFVCPSCKSATINLAVEPNNPGEVLFFTCPECNETITIPKREIKAT